MSSIENITTLYATNIVGAELVLGLDISTAVTGVCILTTKLIPVFLGFIDTKKVECFWNVADNIVSGFKELATKYDINQLYVEEDLQKFRSGFSTAATLTTLSKINGIATYNARNIFSIEPTYIKSSLARSYCGIKLKKAKTPKERKDPLWTKKQVFNHIKLIDPLFTTLQWPMTRPSKKNLNGRMRDGCFDATDAYVIARAGASGAHI